MAKLQENSEKQEQELLDLGNRMIRLRYSMDSSHLSTIFKEMSVSDYLILYNLARRMGLHEPEAKVYLSEISKELDFPISRVSRLVQNLQNKGYVYWEHDSKGTYIYLSEIGRSAMKSQQEFLRTFFGNVINKMGRDEFIKCLEQMDRLEEVIEAEAVRLTEEELEDQTE